MLKLELATCQTNLTMTFVTLSRNFKWYVTAVVTLGIWALLAWNHYVEGGIPTHHILAREDLPEVSNIWGGLLLPLLSWFLLYRMERRLSGPPGEPTQQLAYPMAVFYGFFGALIFGIVLATAFTLGHNDIPANMVRSILVLGLLWPIYRAEYLLGFVIGMTYTFGAILPTGFGSILLIVGAVLHLLLRPLFLWVWSFLRP